MIWDFTGELHRLAARTSLVTLTEFPRVVTIINNDDIPF
jgi:hypothetical protein